MKNSKKKLKRVKENSKDKKKRPPRVLTETDQKKQFLNEMLQEIVQQLRSKSYFEHQSQEKEKKNKLNPEPQKLHSALQASYLYVIHVFRQELTLLMMHKKTFRNRYFLPY